MYYFLKLNKTILTIDKNKKFTQLKLCNKKMKSLKIKYIKQYTKVYILFIGLIQS